MQVQRAILKIFSKQNGCVIVQNLEREFVSCQNDQNNLERLLIVMWHGGSMNEFFLRLLKIMPDTNLHEKSHLKIPGLIESNTSMNQPDFSEALDVNLEGTDYRFKARLNKKPIKVQKYWSSKKIWLTLTRSPWTLEVPVR